MATFGPEIDTTGYINLTTYKKDGTPVTTVVWAVRDGDAFIITTAEDAGKAKRARATGRAEVGRGGIVRDAAVHERVIADVSAAAAAIGLAPRGMTPSPITGATGNQEYLLHLRAMGPAEDGVAFEASS